VNTHRATEPFHFDHWQDRSPPASTLNFLSVLLIARLRTYKEIDYSPKASKSFAKQKKKFIKRHHRDTHYDYSCDEEIPHQSGYSLVHNPKNGEAPWFTSCCCLLAMDMLLIGWIQRYKLNSKAKVVEYKLEKYIIG
jgi:hypothetical protein